jgi:hypothetical protein
MHDGDTRTQGPRDGHGYTYLESRQTQIPEPRTAPAPDAHAEPPAADPQPVALEMPNILAYSPAWTAEGQYIGQYQSLRAARDQGARFVLLTLGTFLDLNKPTDRWPNFETVRHTWADEQPHPSDTADAAAQADAAEPDPTFPAHNPSDAAEPPLKLDSLGIEGAD